jgi:hypothetical protein
MVVYKFGMNKSCFGKGLWAFVLCRPLQKCHLICGSGLFEQRHSIPLW